MSNKKIAKALRTAAASIPAAPKTTTAAMKISSKVAKFFEGLSDNPHDIGVIEVLMECGLDHAMFNETSSDNRGKDGRSSFEDAIAFGARSKGKAFRVVFDGYLSIYFSDPEDVVLEELKKTEAHLSASASTF